QYAREKGIAQVHLPAIPQNSVVAAIRTLGERYTGVHAFSGLDPLATTQRLLSRPYRQHFFQLGCELIEKVIEKTGALILIFDAVSFHDFILLEFFLELNRFARSKNLPLAIVATSDSDPSLKAENPYWQRFQRECCAFVLPLPAWSKLRATRYVEN